MHRIWLKKKKKKNELRLAIVKVDSIDLILDYDKLTRIMKLDNGSARVRL